VNLTVNRDLQASHKILRLLQESALLSEAILDQLPGIVLLLDDQLKILRGNPLSSHFLGVDVEEIVGHDLAELFVSNASFRFLIPKLQAKEDPEPFQAPLRDPQGQVRVFYWFVRSLLDRSGKRYLLVLGEDVTQVQEYEQRLIRIYNSTPLGIFSVNRKGRLEKGYSRYLLRLLGVQRVEEMPLMELFSRERARLSTQERLQFEKVLTALGGPIQPAESLVKLLPRLFFIKKGEGPQEQGLWVRMNARAVESEGVFSELLVILEDLTEQVESQKKAEQVQELEKRSQAFYEMAVRDPLTGLHNRLYLADASKQLQAAVDRGQLDRLTLVLMDIDHFKLINDKYGHQAGDEVLRTMGNLIGRNQRKNDLAVRWGGEEFLAYLMTDSQKALIYAERVSKAIRAAIVHFGSEEIRFTISLGIAQYRPGESLDDVLGRADQALYAAKNQGRDRYVIWSKEMSNHE
jgi:diguanylate cyclase (GGDEF)-like protein/PAS domain S-box-containing protein